MIDHQPKELQELADAGVDLDLCGHTHNGQTFPGNFTIKLMWENPCGLLSKDNMTNITTSGAGVWGRQCVSALTVKSVLLIFN